MLEASTPVNVGAPSKWVLKPDDVEGFRQSGTFAKIMLYINACTNACKSCRRSAMSATYENWTSGSEAAPPHVRWMRPVIEMFEEFRAAVSSIPLQNMKEQRFGNKAFRDFHAWLDDNMKRLLTNVARALPGQRSDDDINQLVAELSGYIKDSFGNGTRLDFGTGHELHFFLFLIICLEECEAMSLAPDGQQALLGVSVLYVFWEYIEFMRIVQSHYKLEPAGSHGVWGLDDYHHLSFIFGASQLVGAEVLSESNPSPILPKHITEGQHVEAHRGEYLYFNNIGWIRDNKKGPFHEHSSMLYNISGIDDWNRITAGMIKMFEAEVLLKFNVVQHLLFGPHLPPPALREGA